MSESVLYLSYDGLTDPLGQSQILPYLSGLAKRGYRISIISFEKAGRYSISEAAVRQQCLESAIDWHPQVYHKRPAVLSTLYDLYVLWRVAKKLVRDKQTKIVHSRSYLTALIGLRLKRKAGVKLIFDMRGFWADERIEGGIWRTGNPVYRLIYNYFKRAERRLVKCSDHVVVLTEAAREEIASWQLTNRITVIPCCVDTQLFDPSLVTRIQKEELRRSLGIGRNDFVLLYLGSLGTWYMLDEMIGFFKVIRQADPTAKFLLLSPDVVTLNEEGIITRTASRTDVPKFIAIANASVCFIRPSFSKKGSSATKMAEVLAMNIPVVSNTGWGDIDLLSQKVHGLISIQAFDHIPGQLLDLDRIDRQTDFFYEYFSLSEGIRRYETIYQLIS